MYIETCELVRALINKKVIPEQIVRPGNPGYSLISMARLFAYAFLKGIRNDKALIRHLKNNPNVVRKLGFERIPHRTTIGRSRKKYSDVLRNVFERLSGMIQQMVETEKLIADSTPLEDETDPDARVGFYSKGPFKGFKVHLSVNQEGIPLKAEVTPGNRHDCPMMPKLLVKSKFVLGDAGYDSKGNRKLIKAMGAKPLIAKNRRRSKKRRWTPRMLRKFRYLVEQFNSILKGTLQRCWMRFKGIEKKMSIVYSALISILLVTIKNMILDSKISRKISEYWY